MLAAMRPSVWDLSNRVLYEFVADNLTHERAEVIAAKFLIIGRVYAAAIERGVKKKKNENIFLHRVVPKVQKSGLDWLLDQSRDVKLDDPNALEIIVRCHYATTRLFNSITLRDNRSLASKYLHFHRPSLFYIYDSKAVKALRKFGAITGRASRTTGIGDNEYRKYAEKCDRLRRYCQDLLGLPITPRQVDNFLLKTNETLN